MALVTDGASGTLALWICNGLAAGLILARLALRKQRRRAFTPGDAWVAVALVFNGSRSELDIQKIFLTFENIHDIRTHS